MYFDGDRKYGYGGYTYDGRWVAVAKKLIETYDLKPQGRDSVFGEVKVLDVGCAKGFLVYDLLAQGIDAYGLDTSRYALDNCMPAVVGRLHRGIATVLPFPDDSFDLVVSFNTLHNLPRDLLKMALREIMRVSKGPAFVQVDSYHTPEQKKMFEEWVLTAEFHDYPEGWLRLFDEAGYTGDYDWTIVTE